MNEQQELVRQHQQFPGLDTIRAVASLAVVTTHVAFWAGYYPRGFLGTLTARLDVGVAIFFVLSGFLLSRPYLAAWRDRRAAPNLVRYARKRFARVMPLAWLVMVVALVALPDNDGLRWGDWLRNLTLTQIYTGSPLPAGLTHLWSLATEVSFYVALPVLAALLGALVRRRRTAATVLGACLLLIAASAAWIVWVGPRDHTAWQWLPGYLGWFAAGIILAVLWEFPSWNPRPVAAIKELATQAGACWVLALALLTITATPIAGPASLAPATTAQHLTKVTLYLLIAALVVLPCVFGPHEGTLHARIMGHPVGRHLGLISYSIFCVHLLVLHAVSVIGDFPVFGGRVVLLWVWTVVGTLAVSELTYRFVEAPWIRWGHRRGPATQPAAADTDSTASH